MKSMPHLIRNQITLPQNSNVVSHEELPDSAFSVLSVFSLFGSRVSWLSVLSLFERQEQQRPAIRTNAMSIVIPQSYVTQLNRKAASPLSKLTSVMYSSSPGYVLPGPLNRHSGWRRIEVRLCRS